MIYYTFDQLVSLGIFFEAERCLHKNKYTAKEVNDIKKYHQNMEEVLPELIQAMEDVQSAMEKYLKDKNGNHKC